MEKTQNDSAVALENEESDEAMEQNVLCIAEIAEDDDDDDDDDDDPMEGSENCLPTENVLCITELKEEEVDIPDVKEEGEEDSRDFKEDENITDLKEEEEDTTDIKEEEDTTEIKEEEESITNEENTETDIVRIPQLSDEITVKRIRPSESDGEELQKVKKKNSSLRCQYRCPIRFRTVEDRTLHYEQCHANEDFPILACEICGKSGFRWECTLKQHVTDCHYKDNNILICEFCEKIFTRRDSYKEHLLIHNGPRHKCSHCEKEFVQKSNLIRHERIHTGTKPYKCNFCDACFSDKGACKSHENIHTRLQTCVCTYCGQQFSKQQKLRYHLRKHTGEGLVSCPVCQKAFTNSSSLRSHLLIHTKTKPDHVNCPYACGKTFTNEKNMRKHINHIHERTNLVQCQICTRVLSAHTSLRAHMLVHTGVKHIICLLCKKSYRELPGFRYHLLNKHNIPRKHPLFHQCYYKLTIKEIGIMEKHLKNKKKKSKTPDPDDEVLVAETIEQILKLSGDTQGLTPEALFESVLMTEENETVKRGGKTYVIAPEKGIPVPEFYEKPATDKESLDKKIGEKVKILQKVVKEADAGVNIKTKQTKFSDKDITTSFVNIAGSHDKISELLKEMTTEETFNMVDLDPFYKSVQIPTALFLENIDKTKVTFDHYTTKSGLRLIRLNEDNFKIDHRGRPRLPKKDVPQSEAERMGLDVVTIKGNSDKVMELFTELTEDGGGETSAEMIWLEEGGHVVKVERSELVNILDKSQSDAYVTLNGIKLLYLNERSFKIDSRGRRKIKTEDDEGSGEFIGHLNDTNSITVTGQKEKIMELAKEFDEEPYIVDKHTGHCDLHISRGSFEDAVTAQSKTIFMSDAGIKLKLVKDRHFRIDSRGRKKQAAKESSSEVSEPEEDIVVIVSGTEDLITKLADALGLTDEPSQTDDKHFVKFEKALLETAKILGFTFTEISDTVYEVKDLLRTEMEVKKEISDRVVLLGTKEQLEQIVKELDQDEVVVKDENYSYCVEIPAHIFHDRMDNDSNILKLSSVDVLFRVESEKYVVLNVTEKLNGCTNDVKKSSTENIDHMAFSFNLF